MFHKVILAVFPLLFCGPIVAEAHFQELIPSTDIVPGSGSGLNITLSLQFTHPMEQGPLMDMVRPKSFGVMIGNQRTDLLSTLKSQTVNGKSRWQTTYKLVQPGDHIFYLTPAPYWEPSEDKMIVHYTKVVVDGFHGGEGWDKLVGLPVEIEPLSRPYGLWTHNIFRGRVLKQGKPVPFAEIEVEYRNEGAQVKAPFDPYITQIIKADGHGVFAYAMPRGGWWGFAALIEGDSLLKNPEGALKPVELGGLIWVKTRDMHTAH